MSALTFLIIDDATFIRDMIKNSLRGCFPGCSIHDCSGARMAQSAVKNHRFDMILCDWEMPEYTGEEFLCWIREQEATKDIPFIMVSSRGDRDYIVKAAQSGVSDYLCKPFTEEELVNKIKKSLKKSGKSIKTSGASGSSGGGNVASASIGVLTGSAGKTEKKKKVASAPKVNALAQLRLADKNFRCAIKALSLQAAVIVMNRNERLPQIFEQTVVDIIQDKDRVAQLNGYISKVQSGGGGFEAKFVEVTVSFVDADPDKMAHLSVLISRA